MNGDLLTTISYKKLIEYHKIKKSVLTVGIHERRYEIPLGFVEHKRD